VIWTILIVYMLLTLVFVADSHRANALSATLSKGA
jgi:hypothetical protein